MKSPPQSSPATRIDLARCWTATCERLGAAPYFVEPIGSWLRDRYSEPHRAYHTLDHLAHVLGELAAFAASAPVAPEVEVAAWFHDAIYDTRASDNEERSADAARLGALALGGDAGLADRVSSLVLATRHSAEAPSTDAAILVDADLAVLGAADEAFDAYDSRIREEYGWVETNAYRQGRLAVLRTFVERPRIYQTDFFHDRYEAAARANLGRAIARLDAT